MYVSVYVYELVSWDDFTRKVAHEKRREIIMTSILRGSTIICVVVYVVYDFMMNNLLDMTTY